MKRGTLTVNTCEGHYCPEHYAEDQSSHIEDAIGPYY